MTDTAPTSSPTARPGGTGRGLALLALALGGFGIGTTEFVAMGLLRDIADAFTVDEARAGGVISAYALGVVVGAPLLTIIGARIPRKRLLVLLMLVFALGNTATALAPSIDWLTAGRFLTGLPHGAYFGVASLVAAGMSPPGRQARAVANVLAGLTVAAVIGVPAATWLGNVAGWSSAFAACAGIGVVAVAALLVAVEDPAETASSDPRTELAVLRNPQVWLTLVVATVGFGGMFAFYTYITWTMVEVAGVPRDAVWMVLIVYGLGMVIGNLAGGVLADRGIDRALTGILCAMIVASAGFAVTAGWAPGAVAGVFLVGAAGSALVPGLQMRIITDAGEGRGLAAALNHSALNAANALGAWIGGVVIAAGLGYRAPAVAAALLAAAGLVILGSAAGVRRRPGPRG